MISWKDVYPRINCKRLACIQLPQGSTTKPAGNDRRDKSICQEFPHTGDVVNIKVEVILRRHYQSRISTQLVVL